MCGIVGLIGEPRVDLESLVLRMNDTIRHRGPDDAGHVAFAEAGAAIAMRRLSILDIEGGRQPMSDETDEHWIVFNGEIYNFQALRAQLVAAGHTFRTDHSDTEVLVHGFEEWGTDLFAKLNGMFAIAIYNRMTKTLTIARDRLGEKPLYIARLPHGFAIASELKALFAHPDLRREVDPVALEQYLSFDFVLGPRTMLKGVSKLQPGHFATITADSCRVQRYWWLRFGQLTEDEPQLLRDFDYLLDSAVQSRMVADVPVGLLLSGGLDSTTIGYYMRRHSDDVHSFSISFAGDPGKDESEYSERAARHLGTHHHVEHVANDALVDIAGRMPQLLDEPMGDPSFFPTYVLSEYTSRHVKVAMGGDASDEFLMGYGLYRPLRAMWELDRLPGPARSLLARAATSLAPRAGRWKRAMDAVGTYAPQAPEQRVLSMLGAFNGNGRQVLSPALRDRLPTSVFANGSTEGVSTLKGIHNSANRTVAAYALGYLTEDILVKVDRASMAASLEVRTAFLDPRIIDFLCALPPSLKLRGPGGKYLLRRLMRGRIPDEAIDRVKQGFEPPFARWFRGPLAPLLQEYLEPGRLQREGYFDAEAVSALVENHASGRRDESRRLWLLLQFQLWQSYWLTAGGVA